MKEIESIIERVKKLLSLSQSSNVNEAAAAAAAANRLIDKFRLSQSDLINNDDQIVEDNEYIYETKKVTQWKLSLISVLSKHYGVVYYNSALIKNNRKHSRFILVGLKSDIEITKYMYTWLFCECQRLSNMNAKGRGKVFVSSYCDGFVVGINQQLSSSREEIKKEVGSSIIKIDSRFSRANDFLNSNKNLVIKNIVCHRKVNSEAFLAGKQQGNNLHLGASLKDSASKILKRNLCLKSICI